MSYPPVVASPQVTAGAKPPVVYTFNHASDATSAEQSPDFDDMINSVASGNVLRVLHGARDILAIINDGR